MQFLLYHSKWSGIPSFQDKCIGYQNRKVWYIFAKYIFIPVHFHFTDILSCGFIKTAAMLFHGRVWTTGESIKWAQLFYTLHDWVLLTHRQGMGRGLWSENIKCIFIQYSKTFVNVSCIYDTVSQKFLISKQKYTTSTPTN